MKTEIELQQENLNTLLNLMKENPTLRVTPMVDLEVVCSDDYSSWLGRFGKVAIDYMWCDEEVIYFKSRSIDNLIEKKIEILECNEALNDLSEEELTKIAKKEVEELDWEKVITVNITTPF